MSPHIDLRQILAALDGDRPPASQAHLEQCQECRERLEYQRTLMQARRGAQAPSLSADRSAAMAARFASALAERHRRDAVRARRTPLLLGAAAAASVAIAALALVVAQLSEPSETDADPLAPELAAALDGAAPELPEILRSPALPGPTLDADRDRAAGTGLEDEGLAAASSPTVAQVADPRSQKKAKPGDKPPALKQRVQRKASALALLREGRAHEERGSVEAAAHAYVRSLELAKRGPQQDRAFAAYRALVTRGARQMSPRALVLRAERVAALHLPPPHDEDAAYLACESALAAQSYEPAYRLCSTYLERFPRGPRARDVAYLAATVARIHLGDCRAAVVRYSQALMFSGVLQSFNDEAYFGRALCHAQLGDLEAARADLDLYLHKRPSRINAAQVRELSEQLGRDRPSAGTKQD